MKTSEIVWAVSAVISTQFCGAASAQDTQLTTRLQACARLSKSTERLSCYDRIATTLGSAEPASPPASPETMFGVGGQLSREAAPPKEVQREQIQSISARVKAVRSVSGAVLIDLDNDQTWQQMDDAALLLKAGDPITITRGAFNSFRLSTLTKRASRVKRLQ